MTAFDELMQANYTPDEEHEAFIAAFSSWAEEATDRLIGKVVDFLLAKDIPFEMVVDLLREHADDLEQALGGEDDE